MKFRKPTMIEVMVIIALIGVIAAITVPYFVEQSPQKSTGISDKKGEIENEAIIFTNQVRPDCNDWIAICRQTISLNHEWRCTLSGLNSEDKRIVISLQYITARTIDSQEGFTIEQVHRNP